MASTLLGRSIGGAARTALFMAHRQSARPSSDMAAFREAFAKAKHVVCLTGAGISAESGVPTFRGSGGLWRKYRAQDLATPGAFQQTPSLVWEFYSYRRELVLTKLPNAAHYAISDAEKRFKREGKRLVVITQNIDELHRKAGSDTIFELHGTLFKTRCTKCGRIEANHDSPICDAMVGKGDPDPSVMDSNIPVKDLPHCKRANCSGLLRPHVVWFGENLDPQVLDEAQKELDACDLCLVIGTSSIVYPAAMFAPQVAARGVPVAEFNIESTPSTDNFGFHFEGPCGRTLPEALKA
jgi:NAD-dependent deacetylase sirtuin 5